MADGWPFVNPSRHCPVLPHRAELSCDGIIALSIIIAGRAVKDGGGGGAEWLGGAAACERAD